MSVYLPFAMAVDGGRRLSLDEKRRILRQIVREMESVVVGFSGGADSSLLLRIAHEELGDRSLGVIALSPSYPKREQVEAIAFAESLGLPLLTVDTNEVEEEAYASNPTNRCYYCKRELFTHLAQIADTRGFKYIAYGANHDDLSDFRPGHAAAKEYGARAPLVEAGLTKPEIRHLSRELGLPTWNKPAMACLSSRFPYKTRITAELLSQVEQAEDYLRHDLGFEQVRVRHHDTIARIEVSPDEINRLLEPALREKVSQRLKLLGYQYVSVELTGYKSGSLNAALSAEPA